MKASADGIIIFLIFVFLILFLAFLKPAEKSSMEIKDFYCTGAESCTPRNCASPHINPALRAITNENATCRFSKIQQSYNQMQKEMVDDQLTTAPAQQHFIWGERIPWNSVQKFFVSCVDSKGKEVLQGMFISVTSTLKSGNCDVVVNGKYFT